MKEPKTNCWKEGTKKKKKRAGVEDETGYVEDDQVKREIK